MRSLNGWTHRLSLWRIPSNEFTSWRRKFTPRIEISAMCVGRRTRISSCPSFFHSFEDFFRMASSVGTKLFLPIVFRRLGWTYSLEQNTNMVFLLFCRNRFRVVQSSSVIELGTRTNCSLSAGAEISSRKYPALRTIVSPFSQAYPGGMSVNPIFFKNPLIW